MRVSENQTVWRNPNGSMTRRIGGGINYFEHGQGWKHWRPTLKYNADRKEFVNNKGRNFKSDSSMVIYLSIGERSITMKPLNTLTPKPQGRQEGETIFWRNAWLQADWKAEQIPEGFRGTIIIKGAPAPPYFEFEHTFSGVPIEVDGAIYMDGMRINKPIAWDANGKSIPVSIEMSDPVGEKYIVKYALDVSAGGFTFPYYLDPTVTIDRAQDIRDTDLLAASPDDDRDALNHMFIGAFTTNSRIIIAVNLSDSIPDGVLISSAILVIKINGINNSPDATTRIYRMAPDSADFANSYADWNHRDHGAADSWNMAGLGAGVDYLSTQIDEIESKLVAGQLDTFDITTWVREIVEDDSVNFGLFLRSATETASQAFSYHSMQASSASDRPFVEITYTVPPPPPPKGAGRRTVIRRGRGTSRGRKLITTSPVNWEDGKITTEKLTRFEQWIESAFKQLGGRTAQQFEFISVTTGSDSTAQFQRREKGKILSFTVFDKLTGGATLATAITSTRQDQDTGWFKGEKNREYLITIIGE